MLTKTRLWKTPSAGQTRAGLPNAARSPKTGLDARSPKPKLAGNEPDAKAIRYWPRSVKKEFPISNRGNFMITLLAFSVFALCVLLVFKRSMSQRDTQEGIAHHFVQSSIEFVVPFSIVCAFYVLLALVIDV